MAFQDSPTTWSATIPSSSLYMVTGFVYVHTFTLPASSVYGTSSAPSQMPTVVHDVLHATHARTCLQRPRIFRTGSSRRP